MLPLLLAVEIVFGAVGAILYPWGWLPALLGLAVGSVGTLIFSSPSRPWLIPFWASYFGCVVFAWSLSAVPVQPEAWYAGTYQGALLILGATGIFSRLKALRGSETKLFGWLSVIFLMGVAVGFFSSSVGGAGPMVSWLIKMGYTPDRAHLITFIFRKSVHFSYYGTLGIAGTFAASRIDLRPLKSAATGLLIVFLTAGFDELRQSSQPGRTGSAYDVLLDMTGALVFILVALCTQRWGRSRRISRPDTGSP